MQNTGVAVGLGPLFSHSDSSDADLRDVRLDNGEIFVSFEEEDVDYSEVLGWSEAGIDDEDLTTNVFSNPKNPWSSRRSDSPQFVEAEDMYEEAKDLVDDL